MCIHFPSQSHNSKSGLEENSRQCSMEAARRLLPLHRDDRADIQGSARYSNLIFELTKALISTGSSQKNQRVVLVLQGPEAVAPCFIHMWPATTLSNPLSTPTASYSHVGPRHLYAEACNITPQFRSAALYPYIKPVHSEFKDSHFPLRFILPYIEGHKSKA
jgi:hypothetical protein